MAYLTNDAIDALGLRACGRGVKISEFARIYNPAAVSIGDNVRIDDFCILSAGTGGIALGSHIHFAAYSSIIGKGAVSIANYCNISSRVSIYSSSDDYSGEFLTSPVIHEAFTNVNHSPVRIAEHCIVGCGSVILPGTCMGKGVAIGALSLVKGQLKDFTLYGGVPLVAIKDRRQDFLMLEASHRDFFESQIEI